jgi:spore germination protein KB
MQKINLSNYNTLLFFLLRASFVGGVSANLLITAQRDSLLSTIIASILGIIPLIIFYFLIKSYPRKNIIEIINEVFGKTFGTLINLILSLFIIFNASLIFRNLINFISSQFLYQTPDLIIGLVFIIAIIYSLYHGITTISRSSTILFYLFSILFLISLIGLFNQANLTNFLPMLEYGINPVLKGTYNYISLNILPIYILTIIPYNEIENHRQSKPPCGHRCDTAKLCVLRIYQRIIGREPYPYRPTLGRIQSRSRRYYRYQTPDV